MIRHFGTRLTALVLACGLAAGPAFADPAGLPGAPGGSRAAVSPAPSPATATVTRTGTITVDVTITLKSTVPTGQGIYCQLTSSLYGSTSIYENAAVKATRNGNTATCAIKLPYSWRLADTVGSISNSLWVFTGQVEGASTPMARTNTTGLPTISGVPANGTTTAFTAAITL